MRRSTILSSLFAGALGLAAIGCGTAKPPPEAQAPATAPAPSPAPVASPVKEPVSVAAPSVAPAGKESPKAAPTASAAEPSKPATPQPAAAVKEPAPAPVAAPSKPPTSTPAPPAAAEPKKAAEVPETHAPSAHAKVGPEKCMVCHRVQYNSWNESKHKAKGLDCEGCHGNGADYKAVSVMKDRPAAMKAGLLMPGLVFCKKCHVKADASMIPLVHAHKAK